MFLYGWILQEGKLSVRAQNIVLPRNGRQFYEFMTKQIHDYSVANVDSCRRQLFMTQFLLRPTGSEEEAAEGGNDADRYKMKLP